MLQYFGYGSNLNVTALRAKGVEPRRSVRATLRGWKLRFNVRHWFRHEGGVGNIQFTGDPGDQVQGLVHDVDDAALATLDALESYGVAYDRAGVEVQTADGAVRAVTYVGLPRFLDDGALPSRRYLNILVRGAVAAGLDGSYVDALRSQPVLPQVVRAPFEHPPGHAAVFDRESLARHLEYTALAGAVFDMTDARSDLDCVKPIFGGKDMTLFHLKRLDTSDGTETLDDVREGRVSDAGLAYLNAYLHEYQVEYRYVGRYVYD